MGGTLYPFPNVPEYPGVPALIRPAQEAIASSPVLSIGIGSAENLLIGALQQAAQWGIFDQSGNQLGLLPNSQSTLQAIGGALLSQLTGSNPTVLSTFSLEFSKEMRVSDFPVENGGFASYNKVELPASPTVTLILDGSENDRTAFLNLLNAACLSTDLYNVVTPEVTYYGYSIEKYSYSRRSSKGTTLLIVEVSLKEIRQVTAALTNAPIVNPQDAAATPQVNGGNVQPATPDQSALLSLATGAKSLWQSSPFAALFNGGSQ